MTRADDERVLGAARRVLAERHTVPTQRRFGDFVNAELQKETPHVSVTAARVRRLVAAAAFCRLEYKARDGPAEKVLSSCPVCGGRLDRLKNQTLFGGEVTLVMRCPRCHYRTGKKKRIPTVYSFHWRPDAA